MSTGKWTDYINPAVQNMPPSGIRRFFDLAAEMEGVISLGVGEPDFATPWHIRESCIYSLHRGRTSYTSNQGLPELREEIARYLAGQGAVYDPRRELLVTVGVSEALDLALRTVIQPGDEVIIPTPCYVSYIPCTTLAGGVPVTVATRLEDNFRLTADRLEAAITPRTKALLLCYPNNPTGAVMDRQSLLAIAEVVAKHDLLVISDEIYDRLTYTGRHTCFAALPGMRDRTILLNGFSKAYAMTGWRLGYAAAHPDFIAAMTKIHQYTMLCAPITAQVAALEALRHGQSAMEQMVAQYNRRRRLVLQGFKEIGLPCFEPGGAFYAFPYIGHTGLSAAEFAENLLREEKVAVIPGDVFGPGGEQCIRCSYASSVDDLTEAVKRMGRFIKNRTAGRARVVYL
ncbi:aminotransferase class I/II-fold pyridoxal phosphate-dependent enzyme [Desulforamulus hydrothermalis]|uniref:Aminotransferase n=1 Tax=Desulforamulus hydrothermalis Lam5 = DSM 18033 TaxID=1121428 RepID=K8DZI9_9FIRM|nr:aminotransferase class I/II-fold pyridoxal phosphate-dependent enzyme [Desulforamulus hydrothermalis]CCO08390.1 putative aminotransferase YugH [Desulforamulus hydrothermalis Lam5 = DSM 18033]SHH14490.1 aminotransferase [Desulforamulus hydrothermalis Lam5 = DSM 18033]